jgi:xylan 1,4-beta-xylosidase
LIRVIQDVAFYKYKNTESTYANSEFIRLLGFTLLSISCWAQSRTIDLNMNVQSGSLNTSFKAVVGAGRANEGLRADWQRQLAKIKRDADLKLRGLE